MDDKENSCAGLSTAQSSAPAEQSTEVDAGDWSGRNWTWYLAEMQEMPRMFFFSPPLHERLATYLVPRSPTQTRISSIFVPNLILPPSVCDTD